MSLLTPASTPGVVLARLQTLRPLSGSSTIARLPMVSETVALSVVSSCAFASTLTDSVNPPTLSAASVRTTWLPVTWTPVALKVWKPVTLTVIS
jgi:hypothetical protein